MSNLSQRDAFWNKVYELAHVDKNVIVITADMGAPSLDKFKRDMPSQFVNAGIAEQNAILIAAGLSMAGKKTFVYAIAPFITLRCIEQIRVAGAIMKKPITMVGVGAGFSYEDSGPTHHIIEDMAMIRAMPNIAVNNITDSAMAYAFADISYKMKISNYIRLDRQILPAIYKPNTDFSKGLSVLKEGRDCYIVSTGCMTHTALDIAKILEEKNVSVGVIDIYTLPVNEKYFMEKVKKVKKLVSLEEHFLPGGLGSAVCEILNDHNALISVKRLGLSTNTGYCYIYGGRETIRGHYGINRDCIEKEILKYLQVRPKLTSDDGGQSTTVLEAAGLLT